MPLSDPAIKKAKLTDKPYKLADEKGLYLLVNAAGKYWRLNYRFDGKRKTLALGVYPDVSLARAREKRDDARRLLASDVDPGAVKKATKTQRIESAANSFETIARQWYAKAYADRAETLGRVAELEAWPPELLAEANAGNMARPEAMLVAQAHSLDALFCNLARRSHGNLSNGYLDAAATYLKLALRAQAQAVRTLEVLAEMKNPRPVAFVRQANIANGPQQINNGTAAPTRARNLKTEQNQLSGGSHELLPDARASGEASRTHQAMEALGEIDRAEIRRG